MKRREVFSAITFALVATMLPACTAAEDKAPDYRYRLTVEVETPEGVKTGSSVIQVEQALGGAASAGGLAGGQIYYSVRGEAVAVDLPGGRTLFALLRSENDIEWSARVVQMLAPKIKGEPWEHSFDNVLLVKGSVEVPRMWPANVTLPERSAYPMMVTFGDPADPTSVAEVDPDELEATFGEGVRFKRITVELTDDPVTSGIDKRLGWLSNYYDKMLDGNSNQTIRATNRFANSLTQGDFTKGLLQ
jgi:hypothetical protein